MLQNHAKAETEKAEQFMINASETCICQRQRKQNSLRSMLQNHAKAETEKSEVMDGQCTMQRAKTERRNVYDQCSELCREQRQRKQNKLRSMHHAKVRDGQSRTGYGQCFRTNPKVVTKQNVL